MSVPKLLSSLSAYLTRAEELDKDNSNPDSKIMAFSLRRYVMEKAIQTKTKDPEVGQFLGDLMTQLEKDKKSINISETDRAIVCEKFAFQVFSKADEEDRAGLANKGTARTFNVARYFFDILEQFGELSEEVRLTYYYLLYTHLIVYAYPIFCIHISYMLGAREEDIC